MKASDLLVGDSFLIGEDRLAVVTDIEDTLCYDKPKRTIVFDLFTTGLFCERIGWSFYVFFDVSTDLKCFTQLDNESYEEEDY